MSVKPQVKLLGIFEISFTLTNETGLLIRSGKARELLGGADVQALSIEYPYIINGRPYVLTVPYIPGSSLKGRARAMLELALGLPLETTDGKIYQHMKVVRNEIVEDDPYCPVDSIFGTNSIPPNVIEDENKKNLVLRCWAPARAVFRDIFPSANYVTGLCSRKGGCEYVAFEDFLEEKWENRIDRITSAADPRNILRVKPGVEFIGSMAMMVFDLDVCIRKECHDASKYRFDYPARAYMDYLLSALELVEETYLGASGSRGYGQVAFTNLSASYYDLSTRSSRTLLSGIKSLSEFKTKLLDHSIWGEIRKTCEGAKQ